MNIYSALRSRSPSERLALIYQARKYIKDDGFASILESIAVDDVKSIRRVCLALNVYMKAPYIRPRVHAWLKGY